MISDTGTYPTEWIQPIFVPLPMKINANKCNDHRLITLMSYKQKIFLKIPQGRLAAKCEVIGEPQFGFRKGLGALMAA